MKLYTPHTVLKAGICARPACIGQRAVAGHAHARGAGSRQSPPRGDGTKDTAGKRHADKRGASPAPEQWVKPVQAATSISQLINFQKDSRNKDVSLQVKMVKASRAVMLDEPQALTSLRLLVLGSAESGLSTLKPHDRADLQAVVDEVLRSFKRSAKSLAPDQVATAVAVVGKQARMMPGLKDGLVAFLAAALPDALQGADVRLLLTVLKTLSTLAHAPLSASVNTVIQLLTQQLTSSHSSTVFWDTCSLADLCDIANVVPASVAHSAIIDHMQAAVDRTAPEVVQRLERQVQDAGDSEHVGQLLHLAHYFHASLAVAGGAERQEWVHNLSILTLQEACSSATKRSLQLATTVFNSQHFSALGADDQQEFVQHVVRLLSNPKRGSVLASAEAGQLLSALSAHCSGPEKAIPAQLAGALQLCLQTHGKQVPEGLYVLPALELLLNMVQAASGPQSGMSIGHTAAAAREAATAAHASANAVLAQWASLSQAQLEVAPAMVLQRLVALWVAMRRGTLPLQVQEALETKLVDDDGLGFPGLQVLISMAHVGSFPLDYRILDMWLPDMEQLCAHMAPADFIALLGGFSRAEWAPRSLMRKRILGAAYRIIPRCTSNELRELLEHVARAYGQQAEGNRQFTRLEKLTYLKEVEQDPPPPAPQAWAAAVEQHPSVLRGASPEDTISILHSCVVELQGRPSESLLHAVLMPLVGSARPKASHLNRIRAVSAVQCVEVLGALLSAPGGWPGLSQLWPLPMQVLERIDVRMRARHDPIKGLLLGRVLAALPALASCTLVPLPAVPLPAAMPLQSSHTPSQRPDAPAATPATESQVPSMQPLTAPVALDTPDAAKYLEPAEPVVEAPVAQTDLQQAASNVANTAEHSSLFTLVVARVVVVTHNLCMLTVEREGGVQLDAELSVADYTAARIDSMRGLLTPGDTVSAVVLGEADGVLRLSTRELEPLPGDMIRAPGRVTRMAPHIWAARQQLAAQVHEAAGAAEEDSGAPTVLPLAPTAAAILPDKASVAVPQAAVPHAHLEPAVSALAPAAAATDPALEAAPSAPAPQAEAGAASSNDEGSSSGDEAPAGGAAAAAITVLPEDATKRLGDRGRVLAQDVFKFMMADSNLNVLQDTPELLGCAPHALLCCSAQVQPHMLKDLESVSQGLLQRMSPATLARMPWALQQLGHKPSSLWLRVLVDALSTGERGPSMPSLQLLKAAALDNPAAYDAVGACRLPSDATGTLLAGLHRALGELGEDATCCPWPLASYVDPSKAKVAQAAQQAAATWVLQARLELGAQPQAFSGLHLPTLLSAAQALAVLNAGATDPLMPWLCVYGQSSPVLAAPDASSRQATASGLGLRLDAARLMQLCDVVLSKLQGGAATDNLPVGTLLHAQLVASILVLQQGGDQEATRSVIRLMMQLWLKPIREDVVHIKRVTGSLALSAWAALMRTYTQHGYNAGALHDTLKTLIIAASGQDIVATAEAFGLCADVVVIGGQPMLDLPACLEHSVHAVTAAPAGRTRELARILSSTQTITSSSSSSDPKQAVPDAFVDAAVSQLTATLAARGADSTPDGAAALVTCAGILSDWLPEPGLETLLARCPGLSEALTQATAILLDPAVAPTCGSQLMLHVLRMARLPSVAMWGVLDPETSLQQPTAEARAKNVRLLLDALSAALTTGQTTSDASAPDTKWMAGFLQALIPLLNELPPDLVLQAGVLFERYFEAQGGDYCFYKMGEALRAQQQPSRKKGTKSTKGDGRVQGSNMNAELLVLRLAYACWETSLAGKLPLADACALLSLSQRLTVQLGSRDWLCHLPLSSAAAHLAVTLYDAVAAGVHVDSRPCVQALEMVLLHVPLSGAFTETNVVSAQTTTDTPVAGTSTTPGSGAGVDADVQQAEPEVEPSGSTRAQHALSMAQNAAESDFNDVFTDKLQADAGGLGAETSHAAAEEQGDDPVQPQPASGAAVRPASGVDLRASAQQMGSQVGEAHSRASLASDAEAISGGPGGAVLHATSLEGGTEAKAGGFSSVTTAPGGVQQTLGQVGNSRAGAAEAHLPVPKDGWVAFADAMLQHACSDTALAQLDVKDCPATGAYGLRGILISLQSLEYHPTLLTAQRLAKLLVAFNAKNLCGSADVELLVFFCFGLEWSDQEMLQIEGALTTEDVAALVRDGIKLFKQGGLSQVFLLSLLALTACTQLPVPNSPPFVTVRGIDVKQAATLLACASELREEFSNPCAAHGVVYRAALALQALLHSAGATADPVATHDAATTINKALTQYFGGRPTEWALRTMAVAPWFVTHSESGVNIRFKVRFSADWLCHSRPKILSPAAEDTVSPALFFQALEALYSVGVRMSQDSMSICLAGAAVTNTADGRFKKKQSGYTVMEASRYPIGVAFLLQVKETHVPSWGPDTTCNVESAVIMGLYQLIEWCDQLGSIQLEGFEGTSTGARSVSGPVSDTTASEVETLLAMAQRLIDQVMGSPPGGVASPPEQLTAAADVPVLTGSAYWDPCVTLSSLAVWHAQGGGPFIAGHHDLVWRLALLKGLSQNAKTPIDPRLCRLLNDWLVATADLALSGSKLARVEAVIAWLAPCLSQHPDIPNSGMPADLPIRSWLERADWSALLGEGVPMPVPMVLQLQAMLLWYPEFRNLFWEVHATQTRGSDSQASGVGTPDSVLSMVRQLRADLPLRLALAPQTSWMPVFGDGLIVQQTEQAIVCSDAQPPEWLRWFRTDLFGCNSAADQLKVLAVQEAAWDVVAHELTQHVLAPAPVDTVEVGSGTKSTTASQILDLSQFVTGATWKDAYQRAAYRCAGVMHDGQPADQLMLTKTGARWTVTRQSFESCAFGQPWTRQAMMEGLAQRSPQHMVCLVVSIRLALAHVRQAHLAHDSDDDAPTFDRWMALMRLAPRSVRAKIKRRKLR